MILKNKFFLLTFFFVVFTTYNFNEKKKNLSIIFPIKEIIIENTLAVDLIKLKAEINFLRNTSLFFLKKKEITKVIDRHEFISSIKLKKKYPNTLKIVVTENIPVATEINEKKKYYLTQKGKKISYIDIKIFKNLPVIFGNHKNFSTFFTTLEKSNFKINSIKAFYYFNIGRWDIVLKDKTTIKLPEINYQKILLEINSVLVDPNFSEYKIFDYRVKDQLILQ